MGQRAWLILIIVWVTVAALSPPAAAEPKDFIPTIYGMGADLEFNMSYQKDENTTDGRGAGFTDIFLREKINWAANGYVYHPRFIQFLTKLSAGLKEEDYQTGGADPGWETVPAWEYDLRALVLPEHPYNLEVFTLRREPLLRQVTSEKSLAVEYSSGAIFKYKEKPYFATAYYTKDTSESDLYTNTANTYGFNGTYFQQYGGGKSLSFGASYRHVDSSSNIGGGSVSDEYLLSNSIVLRDFDLQSSLNLMNGQQQSEGTYSLSTEQLGWSERLRVRLPWNLDSAVSYSLYENTLETKGTTASVDTSRSTKTDEITFELNHKLYESLRSSFRTHYIKTDYSDGEAKALTNSLYANYSKKIPWGRFAFGPGISRTVSETVGSVNIINEAHDNVSVPGPIMLNNQSVDDTTILVFARYPGPPSELIQLKQGIDFKVTSSGNMFQIDITHLPEQYFTLPGQFDITISYSLVSADVELQTDSFSYVAGLYLFNDSINLYQNHLSLEQKVLSGTLPSEPLWTDSDTFGIRLYREPYTFLAEYQDTRSNYNPTKGWKTEAVYQKDIDPTLNLRGRVFFSSIDYLVGSSGQPASAYTEDIEGADAGLQKRFPERNLSFSVSGGFSHRTGLAESQVSTISSTLQWRVGKLTVDAGATASVWDTEFKDTKSERTYQFYFLNLKRTLF